MDKAEIKRIGDYLKQLEQGLYGGGYDTISMQAEQVTLYKTIEQLMAATFKTKDQELKKLLAYMEMRLRKCKKYVEQRLAVRN